jgi:hypothetical protein
MAKKSVSMQKDLQVLERFLGLPVGSTSEVFEIFS